VLWDKAISIWILSGMGVATVVTYPRELRRLATWRRLAVACASTLVGALPLVAYNLKNNFATLHQDSAFVPGEIPAKFLWLLDSLRGGLFEWITPPGAPWPTANLLGILFAGAALLWPWVWKRDRSAARGMLFALVAIAVAWLEMASTRYAGASVHHTILLWPFPQMFVALAFGTILPTTLRTVVVGAVAFHNLFVLHTYRADILEQGSTLVWSEGVYALAQSTQPAPVQYFLVDWGIFEDLALLREGKLTMHVGCYALLKPALTEAEANEVREWIARPTSVFVGHLRGSETFRGNREKLDRIAREMGVHEENVALIKDSHGKSVFEEFRFVAN